MAGMSALTVRANMRMVFDHQEANKAQSAYMARIAEMERGASQHTSALNRGLVNSHNQLVKDIKKATDKADAELLASKEKIAKKVAATSERAMKRSATLTAPVRKGMKAADYSKEAAAYKAAVEKIRAVNRRVALETRAMGGAKGFSKAGIPSAIDSNKFLQQERHVRERIIQLQRQEVKNLEEGTREREMAEIQLKEFLAAQKMVTNEEFKRMQIQKEANAKLRTSESATSKGISLNNRLLKERMALLHRINGAIDSTVRQLSAGFQNALMFSGIALMSFGFKLQGVISDFMAFEKELINAQSIYQKSFDILFDLSDEIVLFGTKYGVTLQDASEGLYTLASAGLEAEDSMAVLTETLKLAMAVQGDHDTIAKLTTQTIFGFQMDVEDTAKIVDQFAHSINKSLIEYQDLASSVKFAMPFFVSTNQELEQLLGALEILSNRALEAGIAGRGLRQTLAEFAQHAEDNAAAFRKMGVEIVDNEGKFKDLTVIAQEFKTMIGDTAANDVELMTTLLEDLNVRGATAFVHLVREADEFGERVEALKKTTGEATKMADMQQKSLANQVQVIKNALMAPFLLSDEVGRTNETLNSFGDQLHNITARFENLFLTKTEDGTRVLTEFGKSLRETVLVVLNDLTDMIEGLLRLFVSMNKETNGLSQVIHLFLIPLKLAISAMNFFGEGILQTIIMLKTINAILPISQMQTVALTLATIRQTKADQLMMIGTYLKGEALETQSAIIKKNAALQMHLTIAQLGANAAMMSGIFLINKTNKAYQTLGYILLALAGAFTAAAIGKALYRDAALGSAGMVAGMVAGAGIMVTMGHLMKQAMKPPELEIPDFSADATPIADLGMRMYDVGGRGALGGRHFPVMVEPGETIVSKTQNMLAGGGITLNIQGDIVTNDADDFAERIAEALPEALRMQNDIGGI